MTLVAASDFHADWETLGVSRYEEVESAVHRSVQYAIQKQARYYIFGGDLADPETGGGTFRAIELAIRTAITLAKNDILSIWLVGNHDVCDTGEGESVLTPLKALGGLIKVANRPMVIQDARWRFLCLPFTSPSHAYEPAEFCKKVGLDGDTIVISHLSIPGIHAGSETNDFPRGRDICFPSKETAKARLRLQGHYHRRQKFDLKDGGPPIQVIGSLCRLGFGEEGNDPGFLSIEL